MVEMCGTNRLQHGFFLRNSNMLPRLIHVDDDLKNSLCYYVV